MDVRCERCSTEYELEDDSVSAEGTDVQCTSCGHTFRVHRTAAGASETPAPSPPQADWLLETASGDGQVHRFRDLTALQKWIIERKVTRDDRISKTGQAWRRLGEIVELQPFFDVVDEADRAKAAAAAAQGLTAQAAEARRTGRTPAAGLSVDGAGTPRGAAARSSEIMPVEAPSNEAEIDTAVVRIGGGGGGWKVVVGLAVAAAVAYFGIKKLPNMLGVGPTQLAALGRRTEPVAASPSAVAPPTPTTPPTPPTPTTPTPTPGTPTTPTAPSATGTPVAAPAVPAEKATDEPEAPVAPTGEVAAVPERPKAAKARAAVVDEAASYEQLVIDGDKALENGASGKASRLFERALKQRPNGAEALAGLGYVNLDKRRAEAAVSYFRRSLAVAPYAPAMFGMGEAYRALGDKARALEAYQRYLGVSPSGADAPAARRQVKALGEADGPVPTPSNILQEGAE